MVTASIHVKERNVPAADYVPPAVVVPLRRWMPEQVRPAQVSTPMVLGERAAQTEPAVLGERAIQDHRRTPPWSNRVMAKRRMHPWSNRVMAKRRMHPW